jgi:N-methylhydantoinase B/oxoprolinase/acetone carboxylase alpha subunit
MDATTDEFRAGTVVDPVTAEIVRYKLEGIANEMNTTILRSAFSPIVKEGRDASASIFTPTGEPLAQSSSIPIHLATLIPAVGRILETYPVHTMREGDVFILNDPYCGGTHLPDIAIAAPAFHGGRVVAIGATMVHHQDVGGMTAGSVPPNATDIFQEGIRIPALKLQDAGHPNDTLIRMLRQNVRVPDMFMGDLNAQIAASTICARRMHDVAESCGDNLLAAIYQELIQRSETLTRQALRTLPQGTFRHVDFLDNDGIDLDHRVRIEVAVTIKDGAIHFDLSGTDAQLKGPFNCVPSGIYAASYYAVRALTGAQIPTNAGCFRPVSLHLPKGTLVNPDEPAPVNSRTATVIRISGTMLHAIAKAAPERFPAAASGELLVMAFAGRGHDGQRTIIGDMIAGGAGASAQRDGADCLDCYTSNSMNMSAEALELEAPITVHRFALRPDSGGAGKFRGGLGVLREYEVLDGDLSFTHRGERHYVGAPGLAGGGDGATAHSVIHRRGGAEEEIPSKLVTTLRKGDRLIVETAGAGGHGDPHARERAAVTADVRNGKVTARAAREVYGFVP